MKFLIKPLLFIFSAILFLSMEANGIENTHFGIKYSTVANEKTYVHTDREIYIAGDQLFFKLYAIDEASLHPTLKSKIAYISIRNEQNHTIANVRVKLVKGIAYGSIYLSDTLSTGYYQLLSFTNSMRNRDESTFFTRELFIANQFDKDLKRIINGVLKYNGNETSDTLLSQHSSMIPLNGTMVKHLSLSTDKNSYYSHEKISLSLKFDGLKPIDLTSVSVSVFEQAPEILNHSGIEDQLKIRTIEKSDSAEFWLTFNKLKQAGITDEIAKNLTNDVLRKKNNLRPSDTACKYLPELQGQILQGKVYNESGNQPLNDACVFLSTADSLINLKYTYTDSSGMFRFLLDDFYEGKELNVKVKTKVNNQKSTILFDDKFAFSGKFSSISIQNEQFMKDFILKSQDITKINKVYHSKFVVNDSLISANASKFISFPRVIDKPLKIVRPSDFTPLPDFVEISKEILPTLRTHKKDGIYVSNFINSKLNMYFENSPVIFLDGILIDDINQILALNSQQISRIECTNSPRVLGNLSFDGILAVFTKKNESDNVHVFNNVRIPAGTTLPFSLFNNPAIKGRNEKYVPDFRQLLFWDPMVVVKGNSEKKLEFFASDNTGTFLIKVEGLTADGQVVCAYTKITIETPEK